MKIGKLL